MKTLLATTTVLCFADLAEMWHSSSATGGKPKLNYNKHFPKRLLLSYRQALENLPNEKILSCLKDWNCEWLPRPNVVISEMTSTLTDNWSNIVAYKWTIYTDDVVNELENFLLPLNDCLRRLNNKDRSTNDPPTSQRRSRRLTSYQRATRGGTAFCRLLRIKIAT